MDEVRERGMGGEGNTCDPDIDSVGVAGHLRHHNSITLGCPPSPVLSEVEGWEKGVGDDGKPLALSRRSEASRLLCNPSVLSLSRSGITTKNIWGMGEGGGG